MSKFFVMVFFLVAFSAFFPGTTWAQEPTQELAKPISKSEPELTKVRKIPNSKDDQATEAVLNGILKEAGWFPELTIRINNGLVFIEGTVKDKTHLDWLVGTADRLPSVLAVINKAKVQEPAVSDLSPVSQEMRRLIEITKKKVPLLGLALILLVIFFFAAGLIARINRTLWGRYISNPFLVSVVSFVSLLPLYAIMMYIVLATLGLSGLASTIIGGTGILGIVMGFAFKGIAENFLSGVLLAIRSPFTKGDTITVGSYTGVVQNLNMRGTTVMDSDGNLILIPNAIVIQSVVVNTTANPKTRYNFVVGIGYGESLSAAEKVISDALKKIPEILAEPPPLIVAESMGSSSIVLKVFFWIDVKKSSALRVKSKAIEISKAALLEADIELPDDAREVILKREPKSSEEARVTVQSVASAMEPPHKDHQEKAIQRLALESQLPGNESDKDLLR